MPAVVPEASVARAPARSQATGMRPHAETDQASSSPFSELLDGTEPADGVAVDPAATAVESKSAETAPRVAKAEEPEAVKPVDGTEAAEAPANLLLVMAMAGQQPAPGTEESKPVTVVAPQQAGSDEAQSDADPSPKTDAPDDVTVAAQPVPLPAVVPVPVAVPAAIEASVVAPATSSTPELAAVADVKTAVGPAMPAADTPDAKLAAPIAPPAEMKVAEAKPAEAKAVEAKPAEAKPVETKPVEIAPVDTKPVGAPATERKARAEKPAGAAAKAGAVPSIATEADTTATPTATTAAAKPAADADVSAQKAATEAAAGTPRGDVEITDAKPKPSTAQLPQDATVNSAALPAPVAHAAAPQAAQPAAHQAGPADVVPISGLAVEIAAHAQAGKSHFDIRLDPPELGRIDVRLEVDSDGQVTSHLRVERAETLDLLRRDAPALERALQQAGLKTSDSALQFSLRDQSFSQNQGRDTPIMARIVVPDDAVVPAETQRHYGRLAGLGSGVDIRV